MRSPHQHRRDIDARFFGLDGDPATPSFVVTPHLTRHDGKLYGGTAIAVSLAAIEDATGRDAVWATTQLVSMAELGSRIDCQVEIVAEGRRTVQARVSASCADALIFTGVGAAATLKADGVTGCPERMPNVSGPDHPATEQSPRPGHDHGWHTAVDIRAATPLAEDPSTHPLRTYLWMRLRDGEPLTPARLAFIADMVPVSVMRACGKTGAGTSLDNTLRVGPLVQTEWVLLDLRPHFAYGGYAHGDAYLWSQSGVLMATGSQSSTALVFDRDPLTEGPPPRRPAD